MAALDQAGIEPGKMFVGGISWNTNEEKLKEHFSKYGEVLDCTIMKDPNTPITEPKHRGFGFVTFADPASVAVVIASGPHILDGKQVDPKQATAKVAQPRQASHLTAGGGKDSPKKIFVGGLPSISKEKVAEFFSQIGPVKSVDLKYDQSTQRMRGFGFVEFETEEAASKAVSMHFHSIEGKKVEAKKAELNPHGSNPGGAQYDGGYGSAYFRYPNQQFAQQQASYQGYGQQGSYYYPPAQYYANSGQRTNSGQPSNYGTNYGGSYPSYDSSAYSGGQQSSTGAPPSGQMYGQVDQSNYAAAGARSGAGYTSTTDAYSGQNSYSYGYPYPAQSYQQQDSSQHGGGSYARGGSQPHQQSATYYSSR